MQETPYRRDLFGHEPTGKWETQSWSLPAKRVRNPPPLLARSVTYFSYRKRSSLRTDANPNTQC